MLVSVMLGDSGGDTPGIEGAALGLFENWHILQNYPWEGIVEEQFFTDIKIARLARCARNLWTKQWLRSKHVPELQSNNVQQQIGIFV